MMNPVESIPAQVIAYMLRIVAEETGDAYVCDVLSLDRIDVQRIVACSVTPSARVRDIIARLYGRVLGGYLDLLDLETSPSRRERDQPPRRRGGKRRDDRAQLTLWDMLRGLAFIGGGLHA